MGNYVMYETTVKFNSDSFYNERGFDKAKRILGKHFTGDEYLEPLFELLSYGYTTTKWWTDFNRHLRVASKALNEPLVVFYKDEDGWYDTIEVFGPDWYYGANRRSFVLGMIKMFDLDPLEFVCVSDEDLKDFILGEGFDMVIEYSKKSIDK